MRGHDAQLERCRARGAPGRRRASSGAAARARGRSPRRAWRGRRARRARRPSRRRSPPRARCPPRGSPSRRPRSPTAGCSRLSVSARRSPSSCTGSSMPATSCSALKTRSTWSPRVLELVLVDPIGADHVHRARALVHQHRALRDPADAELLEVRRSTCRARPVGLRIDRQVLVPARGVIERVGAAESEHPRVAAVVLSSQACDAHVGRPLRTRRASSRACSRHRPGSDAPAPG